MLVSVIGLVIMFVVHPKYPALILEIEKLAIPALLWALFMEFFIYGWFFIEKYSLFNILRYFSVK
jgi:hypothetical protein